MVNDINKLPVYQRAVMAETYTINECCWCLGSVKCATFFIGIIYTILSLLTVSASFSYIPLLEENNPFKIGNEFGIYGIYTLITLFKASSVLWLIVNLALLYGTLKEDAAFVAPWVVWHFVLFFVQVIVAVWLGEIVTTHMESHAVELGSIIVTAIISEVLLIYFIIVVNSFYQKLKNTPREYERVKMRTTL